MKRTVCAIAVLLLALSLCACAQKAPEGPAWQEQYDLGVKYLSEGNYEEAIIAFTAAIEIDPKRPEAYAGLADVYAAQGDMDSLRAILEQGVEATGDSGLRSRLDSLDESGGSTAETYDFQTRVTAAGLDVDAEDLTVRVRDSRTAAITVSGLDLRDSYPTNLASSEENEGEYVWEVVIHGQQTTYSVSTASWAFAPGTEDETALADMQHSVWVHTGDRFHYIGDAQMTYTADSITWTFTVAEEYQREIDRLLRYLNAMSQSADAYYAEANDIRDEVDAIVKRYDTYIAALQAKIDADPDNENLKTVYLPEIELAESTCGEILKNMDLVLMGRQYTLNIFNSMAEYEMMFNGVGNQVKDAYQRGLDNGQNSNEEEPEYSQYMMDMIENETGPYAPGCKTLLAETKRNLNALNVFARDFEEANAAEVKTVSSDGETSKEKTTPEVDGLRAFNTKDLSVSYETSQTVDWDHELNTSVDSENVSQILQGGLDFIRKLGEVLEGARDSLYINEYAIAYFPNYVQHYRAVDKAIATEADNKYLSPKSNSYYVPYLASQAELEYIISGNSNAGEAVLDVAARLLGIRMVLNTAAIFTDSAKIAQANTMAAAISGPFAPLVATGLLIAWALAESTFDVLKLQEGEEVLVFKQGSNWSISKDGLVREAVGAAAEYVTEEVTTAANNAISDAAAAVQQAANKAVYDAYQKLSSGADAAVSAAQSSMRQWGQEISSQVPEASAVLNNATAGVTDIARNAINNTLTDAKDQALALVNQTVRNTSKNMQDGVDKLGAQIQEKVTKAVTSALAKVLPDGQVQNTGSNTGKFDVKMDYMDYMRIFLLFMDNTTKVQHIQSLVQANLRYGKQEGFSMAGSFVTVSASMEGSVNYLMMGSGFLPASMQRDGRLKFKVYTNLGY